MRISENIYYRYEENFDDGIVIIFNQKTGDIFEADKESYNILELLRNPNITIEEISLKTGMECRQINSFIKSIDELGILENGH